jgi:two-component system chemotaxis response regulator CheY
MSRRALVVEDDPVVRRLEESLLTHDGYEVDLAADGQTALERLAATKYDVVVLDFELPDVNGIEIVAGLRALPNHKTTPLVMVTGTKDPAARRRGFEAGIAVFMAKPFTAEMFRSIVATVATVAH